MSILRDTSYIDPAHFHFPCRPIISASFLSESALSFGCKFTFRPLRASTPIVQVQRKPRSGGQEIFSVPTLGKKIFNLQSFLFHYWLTITIFVFGLLKDKYAPVLCSFTLLLQVPVWLCSNYDWVCGQRDRRPTLQNFLIAYRHHCCRNKRIMVIKSCLNISVS